MRVLRLALASMMDFRFEPGKVPARLTEWWDRHQDEQLYDGYYESYFWLFEAAPRRPGNGLPSLEGTSRYAFKLDSEQHMGTASTLLVPAKGGWCGRTLDKSRGI